MLIRNNAPVFGANVTPYDQPGEWRLSMSSRNLVSNDHYSGGVEQVRRQQLQNYVTNRQNMVDLTLARTITERFSVSIGIPYVNSSWASRDPRFPMPALRAEVEQNGRGLGDISVSGRYWLLDTSSHPKWNISAGTGLKLPTGNYKERDYFVDRTGNNPAQRYVDQSVQPGDGGWGIMLEAAAFKRVRRALLFGSGSYLLNPRNTNDTPSLTVARLPQGAEPAPSHYDRLVNSVPDQYIARLGATLPMVQGFAASIAWRIEGLPRYDLLGGSNGFRRPGTAMFVEPGMAYTKGRQSFSFNVPLGYFYRRHPDPNTALEGDATFPRHVFLTSYSWKFGGRNAARSPVMTPPPPSAQPADREQIPEPGCTKKAG